MRGGSGKCGVGVGVFKIPLPHHHSVSPTPTPDFHSVSGSTPREYTPLRAAQYYCPLQSTRNDWIWSTSAGLRLRRLRTGERCYTTLAVSNWPHTKDAIAHSKGTDKLCATPNSSCIVQHCPPLHISLLSTPIGRGEGGYGVGHSKLGPSSTSHRTGEGENPPHSLSRDPIIFPGALEGWGLERSRRPRRHKLGPVSAQLPAWAGRRLSQRGARRRRATPVL